MRLVYMDEAGISKDEPFLVVAAVTIHADRQLRPVEEQLTRIIGRYIPKEDRPGFVFHAKELFNGGGRVFKREQWPLHRRLEIADALAAIPRLFGLPVTFGWVTKQTYPEEPERRSQFLLLDTAAQAVQMHALAFQVATLRVDQWMQANARQEVCMLVVEDNAQARTLIRRFHRNNQNRGMAAELPADRQKYFPLRTIKEDPLFQEKRPLSVLQLADFCAYVFKRVLMKDQHYLRFLLPMREVLYDIFHESAELPS
jgi:hypothetical protein